MEKSEFTFKEIALKTIVVHTVTYFLVGLAAYCLFDYSNDFSSLEVNGLMRQPDDFLVRTGVLFQPVRGFLFGIVFFLLRKVLFKERFGWLKTWTLLVFIGIFSTFGPAAGSIEGLIYMRWQAQSIPGGMVEILLQSFLLSILTWYWVRWSIGRWFTLTSLILFSACLILPVLGLWAEQW